MVDLGTDQDRDGILDGADADQNGNRVPDNVDFALVGGTDADNDKIADAFDFSVLGRTPNRDVGEDANRDGIQDAYTIDADKDGILDVADAITNGVTFVSVPAKIACPLTSVFAS